MSQDTPFIVKADAVRIADDLNRVEVRFHMEVPADHYLYRDEVSVEIEETEHFEMGEVHYPAGKVKYDKFEDNETEIYEHSFTIRAPLTLLPGAEFPETIRMSISYRGCTSEYCYFPQFETLDIGWHTAEPGGEITAASADMEGDAAAIHDDPGSFDVEGRIASRGLFLTYLFVFFSGILLSFTPCVFPMIPITLSVIGARAEKSPLRGFFLSLVYVLGMALMYAVLGLFAASSGSLFGSIMQSPVFISVIVGIFVVLALGMFGMFELQVPASFASRMQSVGGGGGWIGVFLMGIVAGLVASPCVGPVLVGLLVYIAKTENAILGFTLLFTLAMGIGVLFLVIGTFSGLITALPGAGGWMDRVKQFFGFLLLGVALYFARPFLPENVVLALAGLLLTFGAAFFGLLEPLSGGAGIVRRLAKSVVLLAGVSGVVLFLAVVLFPFLPLPILQTAPSTGESIDWIEDHDAGLTVARDAGVPVMIDFTADWCAACKELEHLTYTDPSVTRESERFTMILIDATRSTDQVKELTKKYDVKGLPTIVWIDSSGERLDQLTITGFLDAPAFLRIMKQVQ